VIIVDRLPRFVNQKILKYELFPRYFGSTADLSSHKYTFKSDDPMDGSTKVRKQKYFQLLAKQPHLYVCFFKQFISMCYLYVCDKILPLSSRPLFWFLRT